MDIDDFLDRETKTGKKEAKDFPVQQPQTMEKTAMGNAPMTGEGSGISMLEKKYSEMWGQLASSSLSWNASLYREMGSVAEQLGREALASESRIARDRQSILVMIRNANSALDSKNYSSALSLYSKIVGMCDSISDSFFEQKIEINAEIMKIHSRLQDAADSRLAGSILDSLRKTEALIKDSSSALGQKNLEQAKNICMQAVDIYRGIPKGFLTRRISTGRMLLELYREVSIHRQIDELERQLGTQKHTEDKDYMRKLSDISSHRVKGRAEKGKSG